VKIKEATAIAGTLSKPSKMPGWGYGLPALASCKTGSKLARVPGTACSNCYACKGRYMFDNVKIAQYYRLNSLTHLEWVAAMVCLISSKLEKYFRWHDSGDIISLEHLCNIAEIAVRLPTYHFWLPTQEHLLVRQYRNQFGEFPSNLVVRLSTPKIDCKPVTTSLCTSSIHKNNKPFGYECPAHLQGNVCGDCRACWNQDIKNVSYHHH
jgi:hypothetical protein